MKKVNAPFQRISVFPFVLLFSLLFLVMLASVAPANAKTFLVSLYGQGVHAWDWPAGASVEVIIYEDGTRATKLCEDEQTANSDGTVNFNLSCPDFQPGNYVEMNDGTDTKTHVVAGVALTEVDIANNIVKGTLDIALADRRVALQVVTTAFPMWTTIYNEMYAAVADPTTGVWEINLTGQLDDPPGTLSAGMYVEAMWHDAEYQSTRYGWGPSTNVSPDGDFVHTWGWPPNVEVTLKVYGDPDADPICTEIGTSLPDGEGFDFNLSGSCDIVPGNIVTLFESSEPPETRLYIGTLSHTVTYLTVDCVGSVDGFVTGTAEHGSGVLVHGGGEMKYVVTDGSGNWVAGPFEPPLWGVRAENLDELGNGTQVDRDFTDEACLSVLPMPAIDFPFAFADRFPGNAQHLGFSKGNLLALGATIIPSAGCPIVEATATNLDNGEKYDLNLLVPGPFGIWNYQVSPLPLFDPELHLGQWEIYAKDECDNEASAKTHNFDKGGVMPYVKDVRASEYSLTPTITWKPPKAENIPDFCITQYRLRLLTAGRDQFHRSPRLDIPEYTIPAGVLTVDDIPYTWVRIEHRCLDDADGGIELKSETFRPLQDLLMEANGF